MSLLPSGLLSDLVYVVLVAGLWCLALAMVVPGTGVLEVLAIGALGLAGLGTFWIPFNGWALLVLAAGVGLFVLSLRRGRGLLWLALAAVVISAGSAFLFRVPEAGPSVHPLLALVGSILTLGYFWTAIRKALVAARARPAYDPAAVLGQIGEARTELELTGSVYVGGELWTARSERPVPAGARVRVIGREGLVLTVEAVE